MSRTVLSADVLQNPANNRQFSELPSGSGRLTSAQAVVNGTDNTPVKFNTVVTTSLFSYDGTTGYFTNTSTSTLTVVATLQLRLNVAASGNSAWFQTTNSSTSWNKQTFQQIGSTSTSQISMVSTLLIQPKEGFRAVLFQSGSSSATVWGGYNGNHCPHLTFCVL